MILALSLCFALLSAASAAPPVDSCLCLTGNSVNVRDAPCGNVIGSASIGACYGYLGGESVCSLSGTVYTWWEVDFGGTSGWITSTYLEVDSSSRCEGCNSVNIISRAEWGARDPTSVTYLSPPLPMVFVHHSDGSSCYTESSCISQVQGIQDWHMDGNGWSDIGYNFLVGEDGNAYEGRGWERQGAHASGWNADSYGICVIGTFSSNVPNAAAQAAVQNLIQCALSRGDITGSYTLHGHRDGVATSCPGDALYNLISGWPNFGGPL